MCIKQLVQFSIFYVYSNYMRVTVPISFDGRRQRDRIRTGITLVAVISKVDSYFWLIAANNYIWYADWSTFPKAGSKICLDAVCSETGNYICVVRVNGRC